VPDWWNNFGDWFLEVLHSMAKPDIMAAALLSLIITLISLVFAFGVLRATLKHDRQVAIESATAMRRAKSAHSMGRDLLTVSDSLNPLDAGAWAAQLQRRSIGRTRRAPGVVKLRRAKHKALAVLHDLDDTLDQLAQERQSGWVAAQRLLAEHLTEVERDQTVLMDIGSATGRLLSHNTRTIRELGNYLCRWNGDGFPPGRRSLPDQLLSSWMHPRPAEMRPRSWREIPAHDAIEREFQCLREHRRIEELLSQPKQPVGQENKET
jgi:hypothetical protein